MRENEIHRIRLHHKAAAFAVTSVASILRKEHHKPQRAEQNLVDGGVSRVELSFRAEATAPWGGPLPRSVTLSFPRQVARGSQWLASDSQPPALWPRVHAPAVSLTAAADTYN